MAGLLSLSLRWRCDWVPVRQDESPVWDDRQGQSMVVVVTVKSTMAHHLHALPMFCCVNWELWRPHKLQEPVTAEGARGRKWEPGDTQAPTCTVHPQSPCTSPWHHLLRTVKKEGELDEDDGALENQSGNIKKEGQLI